MLKIGTLKFCLGLSLLFHAAVFGLVKWAPANQRPVALRQEREVITLHLVAAPSAPPGDVVAPAVRPLISPLPESLPVAPPPVPPVVEARSPVEENTEAIPLFPKPVEMPEPTQPPPLSSPDAASAPRIEPQLSAPTTIASARGDGSSLQPGEDATTATAHAGVQAHPNYLKNPEPVYPAQARRRQQQGLVLLEVKVSAKGRALDVSVKESSGYVILDEAAASSVRDWEFEPARVGRTAVESRIEVPVRFKLTR